MAELISKEGNKVSFRVAVPAAEVNRAYDQVWAGLARDVRVPGFRPGKAPRKVLESRVGKGYVENEVRDRLLQVHYPQAARELKLSLVDARIEPEPLVSGQPFSFTVRGETYPEVTLGDWRAVQLTATAPEITDEVLNRTLSDLQERNATFQTVERPIEATDQVTIEELGEEGGSYPVYLDVAEPHVRDALIGKNVGDEVEITVPAHQHGDHEHPEHTVRVRVQSVQTKQLQPLDDEFARSLNFESLDRLRTDLRAELERRARQEGDAARREEFVNQLVEGMQVEIPQALIDRRREAMLEEIQDDLGRQGVKWSEYENFMREQGKLDEFLSDLAKNAESRVKRDLALEKLAEDLGVQLSDAEFSNTMNALAQANGLTPQQLQRQLGPNGINAYYISLTREKALQQALATLNGQQVAGRQEAGAEQTAQAAEQESGQPQAEGEQAAEQRGE
ncbi:FKBP-type peptidyl-prolyl cis-trans isomerase [Deinococcus geothermalis DSM 11300]|uniref:Trigger factor n=1 Tax=Deinococcus geothermalis (strain DSM 11300 / CIP 105573 / AG-3a) TaxID=319795 RepID=TIG_DEIGD|nr:MULTISPECIES: trigger factor [Deinococcus]Q1J199.1 RecName: Full=Trigger factor; Short=TF; AltName: Full=PPIase [Deinococcus geothermalis DSM 11300]ABF44735.1 FKBP-type peptidyl-prolyl cis-trans isomerase [Deinococcus geothermalis DSM 11300]MBI0445805.1 trigger factor [Deinococcus sp. DB0503]TDE87027.1 trigger factor [Deinococcus sp. S9]